tara:strand:+ start:718 stop:1056 length:339 start_codon:yes stop_codon:yes gene_type:complete
MTIPEGTVWIASQWVVLKHDPAIGHFGQFNSFPNPEILIGPVRGEIAAMTVIHEAIEAAADILDLKMKESEIRCLEHCISGMIIRSPEVVDWIVKELRKSEDGCKRSMAAVN